ncbi:hypothetical protein TNCT_435471, partial [Trichonephila clavata]
MAPTLLQCRRHIARAEERTQTSSPHAMGIPCKLSELSTTSVALSFCAKNEMLNVHRGPLISETYPVARRFNHPPPDSSVGFCDHFT